MITFMLCSVAALPADPAHTRTDGAGVPVRDHLNYAANWNVSSSRYHRPVAQPGESTTLRTSDMRRFKSCQVGK